MVKRAKPTRYSGKRKKIARKPVIAPAKLTKAKIVKALKSYGVKVKPERLTKKALLQKLASAKGKRTREKKKAQHEKRSIASRKGWATRLAKPKDLRDWERARKKIQIAQRELIETAKARAPKWPPMFRWYEGIYFNVSELSLEELLRFLLQMKKRGVRMLRYEREVMVGEYDKDTMGRSMSGFVSTGPIFLQRFSEQDLLTGHGKYGLPGLHAMRVPGVDFIRFVVVNVTELIHLPRTVNMQIRGLKRETHATISSAKEQAFYLSKGRRPDDIEELEEELDEIEERLSRIPSADKPGG